MPRAERKRSCSFPFSRHFRCWKQLGNDSWKLLAATTTATAPFFFLSGEDKEGEDIIIIKKTIYYDLEMFERLCRVYFW